MASVKILQVRHSVTSCKLKLSRSILQRLKDLQTMAAETIGQPVSVGAIVARALISLTDEWMGKLRELQGSPAEIEDFIIAERQRLWDAARPEE